MKADVLAGIDFGSKLGGTTVAAIAGVKTIRLFSCKKNEDADQFIYEIVKEKNVDNIFIDVPLSLPGVYSSLENKCDYFYREADMKLKTMSPMFTGAQTARAMKLCRQWKDSGIQCLEVYPATFISRMGWLSKGYKKNDESLSEYAELASEIIGLPLQHDVSNWHELDAILSLAIGKLFHLGKSDSAGDNVEGIIYF